jgi:hypothetical protein
MARAKEAAADARSRVADEVAAAAASAHTALSGPADKLASLSSSTSSSVNARATARLPGPVRFALAVVLNFALTALGRSFVDHWSENEVGAVMREGNSRAELAGLVTWRVLGPLFPPFFFFSFFLFFFFFFCHLFLFYRPLFFNIEDRLATLTTGALLSSFV